MNIFNNFNNGKNNRRIIKTDRSFAHLVKSFNLRIMGVEDSLIINTKEGLEIITADGYVSGGIGQLIDLSTGNVVEDFVTTYNGVYNSEIPLIELPDVFKIIVKGGIDISTGKSISSVFTVISTRKKILETTKYINVNPLTTTYSELAEDLKSDYDSQNESKSYEEIVEESKDKISQVSGLTQSQLDQDYIANKDVDSALYAVQIFSTSQNIANTIGDESIDHFAVIHGIISTIKELNYNALDFSKNSNIEKIINSTTQNLHQNVSNNTKNNVSQFVANINGEMQQIPIGSNTSTLSGFNDVFSKTTQIAVASDDYTNDNTLDEEEFSVNTATNTVSDNAQNVEIKTVSQPRTILQAFPIALNTIAMTVHSYGVLREEYESYYNL